MNEKLYINLNIRFPQWVVDQIDEAVYKRGFGNRSDLCRYLIKRGLELDE